MPSLCKHHVDTADAKRSKHHLDTSRKPPKPQAKKLFHVTFGIHIYKTKTIFGATEHMPSLCKHHLDTADAKRPKHHLDTSRKLQTASQKTLSRHLWNPHNKTIFGATEHMPSLCKHHLDTADAKRPKHHLDTSRKPPKPQAKKPFHVTFGSHRIKKNNLKQPQSTIFGATEHMPSLCKHHVNTADAKRPKHHLDTSRKPPKPQAKKLFHVTFGIHIIKQSLEPQSTCPAYANTSWTLQMQKDPNTIWTRAETRQTASQKTLSNTFGSHRIQKNNLKQPQTTIFGATEHMPGLCKHHVDTADAKRPEHHLDTSRKPPKPQAKKLFHVTFGIHKKKTIFGATEHMPSLCKHHLDTADAKRPKHHLNTQKDPNTVPKLPKRPNF